LFEKNFSDTRKIPFYLFIHNIRIGQVLEVFTMSEQKMKPVHPGEVLREEFLTPLELSQHRLALDIGVDSRRINEIVSGRRSVTANTALRLARYFNTSPEFWLGLQSQYDLDIEEEGLGDCIAREVKVYAEIH